MPPRFFRVSAAAIAMFALLCADVALAQAIGVDVYEFGTYRSAESVEVGVTEKGIVRSQTSGIERLEETRKVIARIGAQFGFRYKITGLHEGTLLPVTIVARFPKPGVLGRKPQSQVPVLADGYPQVGTAGKEDFLTWTFEMRSDLVPGIWTFEIWSDGKKLTEQNFEIILPPVS
jgi:hypothetical protein